MKDTRRCGRVIVTFSTELTATKLHLPCEPCTCEPWLSSNSYISWKGWSWLRLCIVFYRDNLYLKEQNSKVDLKANRFKTSVTSLVGLTEALEEVDFPCCWTSKHLGLKVDLGKMLEQVTAPPSQVLLFHFAKQMIPLISADLLPVVTPLFCLSLSKSWRIWTWDLWSLHVDLSFWVEILHLRFSLPHPRVCMGV